MILHHCHQTLEQYLYLCPPPRNWELGIYYLLVTLKIFWCEVQTLNQHSRPLEYEEFIARCYTYLKWKITRYEGISLGDANTWLWCYVVGLQTYECEQSLLFRIWRFNNARHEIWSQASFVNIPSYQPVSLISMLMLSSLHFLLEFPSGHFPSCFPIKFMFVWTTEFLIIEPVRF
jgi:hypothetical protein